MRSATRCSRSGGWCWSCSSNDRTDVKGDMMASNDVSQPLVPRFDAFLTGAANRRDDWQRLQALSQARAAAAGSGDDSALPKLTAEARDLLARLEPLETFWAFPGPARMQ